MITPDEVIKIGKKLMLKCEVVEDYRGNCYVKVKLPNGEIKDFHLNDFLAHNLKPYVSWEYDGESSQTELYTAIWCDRHTDPTTHLFTDLDKAINWAKKMVREYDRHGYLNEELSESMIREGWLYYGCYSCEGDSIHIKKIKVDDEIKD